MKLKNLIIEAEEELARKVAQYGMSDEEYQQYQEEYNEYLDKTYRLPDDFELDSMCRISRDRRKNVLLDPAAADSSRDSSTQQPTDHDLLRTS